MAKATKNNLHDKGSQNNFEHFCLKFENSFEKC
jgi:hypothetical protein